MSLGSAKTALVAALADALRLDTLVQVTYGTPGPTSVPDVIAVLGGRAATSGEEETFDLEVKISCYVGGREQAQAVATARAYALLEEVQATLYADPTLGNVCRTAALAVGHGFAEALAYDSTGQAVIGRLSEITATVNVWPGRPVVGALASAHRIV